MKRINHVLLVIAIAVISFECQKELSNDGHTLPATSNNQPSPVTVTLQGNVLDENDQPAASVKISAGTKTTTTDSHGYFRIADALLDKNASLAIAELPGYFKAYRSFRATTGVNQLVIKLVKKMLVGTVGSTTGGEVALANGAKVLLPGNGIVKASGGAYTGNVQVYAAYIDPASREIDKIIPGSFMADDKNNNRVVLSSYGMLAVELESAGGEKLQIQTGSAATLTMPIPSSLSSSAPATISLWYVDEQTGIWKEQGTARKTGNSYSGEVKHFSYWNCDIGVPAIAFSAVLKTSKDIPLTNLSVSIRPANNSYGFGTAHGYTDSLGQLSGLIPANANLVMEVYDDCYRVVYSKEIGPFSQNTALGAIIIPNSIPTLVTVTGQLLSCSNTPVSNGYAVIHWNNFVSYVDADATGKFSAPILICTGSTGGFEILGVDATTQQQGAWLTIPVNGQGADAGNITACGLSTTEFMNYTVDGTDYAITNLQNDSLFAFSSTGQGTSISTYIQGSHTAGPHQLGFDFLGKEAAGAYPLNTLSLNYKNVTGLVRPFNVTITTFPQNSAEFYEGNFSGSFTDTINLSLTHKIDCSFRIRKY